MKSKFVLIIPLTVSLQLYSQQNIDTLFKKIDPQKWFSSIQKKADRLENKIIEKSEKTLYRLEKQEEKFYRKQLRTADSSQAREKLLEVQNKYTALKNNLKVLKESVSASNIKIYVPHLDSLSSALSFLDGQGIPGNVKGALSKVKGLQDKLQQGEEIKAFIRERREQLKQQLEHLGLVNELKKFNKEAYYYSQQLREYKEIINNPTKVEKKALELLSTTRVFQDFMRKNSMLASLFRMPGDPNDPSYVASLAGLQTRAQVNNLIQQQISAGGSNGIDQFRQSIQNAQSQLQQLKSRVSQMGGGSSEDIMPDGFKPNNQKTKSFFKRLEYGTNVQTQKAQYYFPVTTDLGLSIGYKLNEKSVVGIGASYKLGLGRGWNHVQFTQEGAGLRSYIDWKLKGSFWISGGYEMNYRTAFDNIDQLRDINSWQQAGLIGVSKVINVKSKFFKKTKLQFLWDFLSYHQVPRTQPIVLRVGYSFK